MKDDLLEILFDEERIKQRVKELGEQITNDYAGKTPLLIGIDKARFFAKIPPGNVIEITARVQSERIEKAIVTCECEVLLDGAAAASGEVTLAMR